MTVAMMMGMSKYEIEVWENEGFGPRNGRWYTVMCAGWMLESAPTKRAAEQIAKVYRSDDAKVDRKIAEIRAREEAHKALVLPCNRPFWYENQ